MGINRIEGVIYVDGWVEALSGRGTLNIVWSCFFYRLRCMLDSRQPQPSFPRGKLVAHQTAQI